MCHCPIPYLSTTHNISMCYSNKVFRHFEWLLDHLTMYHYGLFDKSISIVRFCVNSVSMAWLYYVLLYENVYRLCQEWGTRKGKWQMKKNTELAESPQRPRHTRTPPRHPAPPPRCRRVSRGVAATVSTKLNEYKSIARFAIPHSASSAQMYAKMYVRMHAIYSI